MSDDYDLLVIGGGPAGEKGAVQAAYFGKRVLLVDAGERPGGAAVHTGTLPSKTLRETALYLSGYRARDLYGVSVRLDDPHAAVPKLIARKDTIADLEATRIEKNLEAHGVERRRGRARLLDAHRAEIALPDGSTEEVRAAFVLIATGSLPRDPDNVPIHEAAIFDSDEILGIERLPDTLAILGGGVIGCEYACMFAALGVSVTLVDARSRLLGFLDVEIGRRLEEAMAHLGIEVRLESRWGEAHHDPARGVVTQMPDGELCAEYLLFAAGRVGATSGLGLETIGLAPTSRGHIEVDSRYRTSLENVYAVGDVIGFPALASTSMEQARVAVCDAFDLGYKKRLGPSLPYGIYTIPEVSFVGETEESAAAGGLEAVVGRAEYRNNARGLITGDLEGMTKIIVHRQTRRLLGVHVIGERASELVHIGQAIMHLGGTVDALIEMVFNYPTLSESYKYAAYDALAKL